MKKYIYKNKYILVSAMFFSFITTIFAIGVQFIKGDILDIAVSKNLNLVIVYSIILITLVLLECLTNYFFNQYRMKYAIKCAKMLRKDYFDCILNHPVKEFVKKNTSDYITKFSNDLEILKNMYFTNMTLLMHLIIKILFVSISLFILDWQIAIITIFLLTMPLYIPKLVEKKLINAQNEYLSSIESNLNNISDWFTKFELIKMFSIEQKISTFFDRSNNNVYNAALKDKKMNNITNLLSALMSYFSHIIILLIAIYFVYKGVFTVGSFVVAVGMIDQLSYPIISISSSYQGLISVKEIASRINNDILEFKNRNINRQRMLLKESITLKNLNFKYESQKELLTNLNFKFEKGKKYLIRGESGSGKTTLIDLLLNYQNANSGEIYYDDTLVNNINPFQFVTVIRQDTALLDDTIKNNITLYSEEYSNDDIVNVLNIVNLHKFANEENLNLNVGENGAKVSGGEGKRICIARALLRNSDILIFDEPLANLDKHNVDIIEDILLSLKDKTLIVVSHTFTESKLKKFDKILNI